MRGRSTRPWWEGWSGELGAETPHKIKPPPMPRPQLPGEWSEHGLP